VKRLLLYGPPLSGKSTIVQVFAQERSLATEGFEIRPAGQSFAERGFRAIDRGSGLVAETIAGAVWTMATWDELLGQESEILLVLDPQESRRVANREFVEHLSDRRRRIAAIQVTKTDLVGRDIAEGVGRETSMQYGLTVPIICSTTADVVSVLAAINACQK
jgi:GTPase SAR1 family protein